MVENMKLGIWDYFVYLMTGVALFLIIAAHCMLGNALTIEQIMEVPAAVLVTSLVMAFLLLGMLIEPMANLLFKLVASKPNTWRDKLGFKQWDRSIEGMEKEARILVPESMQSATFAFAKNWVLINGNSSEFQAFLSKYGFYRSIAFVFAVNAIACLVFHWLWQGVSGCVVSALLCVLYSYRASVFYRHMSVSIFNQFVQGHR